MPVYKDKLRGTWFVRYRMRRRDGTWTTSTKRGFPSKRDAQCWELEYLTAKEQQPGFSVEEFAQLYCEDTRSRVRESTMEYRKQIIRKWICPKLGKILLQDLTPRDILLWQNELLAYRDPVSGKPLSANYIREIHDCLSTMLNHAVRFYHLASNPAKAVKKQPLDPTEMVIWSREEYQLFAAVMMEKPRLYYCFEVLYWCGIREGEALALEPQDVDLEKGTISITKTFYILKGKPVIAPPKTPTSRREVTMPDFLRDEMADFFRLVYDQDPSPRLFPFNKKVLIRALTWGAEKAGLPKIRVHDLRHSHISLLIHMGYSAVAIGKRVGHKSAEITYRYGHLMPTEQDEMARQLELERR